METCSISSFGRFNYLPTELRLMIWRIAFHMVGPAVSICQCAAGKPTVSIAHYHAGARRLPWIASACREARKEWMRLTRRCRPLARPFDRLYLPRTVFLVGTSAIVESRFKGLAPSTVHIAFEIANCPDLLAVFEALAQFPRLETIIPIIPSTSMTDEQLSMWGANLWKDSHLLGRMVSLVDKLSPDGEWHQETFVGWLLRNVLDGEATRKYYGREGRPRIKLLIDTSPEMGGAAAREVEEVQNEVEPWSLVLY